MSTNAEPHLAIEVHRLGRPRTDVALGSPMQLLDLNRVTMMVIGRMGIGVFVLFSLLLDLILLYSCFLISYY